MNEEELGYENFCLAYGLDENASNINEGYEVTAFLCQIPDAIHKSHILPFGKCK